MQGRSPSSGPQLLLFAGIGTVVQNQFLPALGLRDRLQSEGSGFFLENLHLNRIRRVSNNSNPIMADQPLEQPCIITSIIITFKCWASS